MSKILDSRKHVMNVLQNVRFCRATLNNHPFNQGIYDILNGKDMAMESLVDHFVGPIGNMTPGESGKLRSEIKDKLFTKETEAFEELRATMKKFFAPLNAKNAVARSLNSDILKRGMTDKQEFIDLFGESTVGAGKTMINQGSINMVLDQFENLIDKLNDARGSLQHMFDMAEPATKEDEPAEDHPEVADPEEVPAGTEDCLQAIDEIADQMDTILEGKQEAAHRGSVKALGYTPRTAVETLKRVGEIEMSYKCALEGLDDVVMVDTCEPYTLTKGSKKFYDLFDRVLDAVEVAEDLRKVVDTTADALYGTLVRMPDFVMVKGKRVYPNF